jgi:hypothetical protein
MESKNLWGELHIDALNQTTPTQILKDQAALLSDMTKSVLQADVTVSLYNGIFNLDLNIVAPAIENYRYEVVSVTHGLEMYPVTVKPQNDLSAHDIVCKNDTEFETALGEILSSERVRRVIGLLLAQSWAM